MPVRQCHWLPLPEACPRSTWRDEHDTQRQAVDISTRRLVFTLFQQNHPPHPTTMATATDRRDWDVEPVAHNQAHFEDDKSIEKKHSNTYANDVDVFAAADDRDPALIPTEEDLRTLPRLPAGMP